MLQSLSRALKEEVRFDERCMTSADRGDVPDPEVFRCPGDGDRPARQRQCCLRCHRYPLAPDAVYAGADTGSVDSERTIGNCFSRSGLMQAGRNCSERLHPRKGF